MAGGAQERVPATRVVTLTGKALELPRDLPAQATVLILGFSRKSVDATTAWEKGVRSSLAHSPEIDFYDMAMLAEVPGFARGWVMRLIRNKVPDTLKPNFVPLTTDEAAWKRTVGFDKGLPDAAYVVLLDRSGTVRWNTHEPWTPERFAELSTQAHQVAAEVH